VYYVSLKKKLWVQQSGTSSIPGAVSVLDDESHANDAGGGHDLGGVLNQVDDILENKNE